MKKENGREFRRFRFFLNSSFRRSTGKTLQSGLRASKTCRNDWFFLFIQKYYILNQYLNIRPGRNSQRTGFLSSLKYVGSFSVYSKKRFLKSLRTWTAIFICSAASSISPGFKCKEDLVQKSNTINYFWEYSRGRDKSLWFRWWSCRFRVTTPQRGLAFGNGQKIGWKFTQKMLNAFY